MKFGGSARLGQQRKFREAVVSGTMADDHPHVRIVHHPVKGRILVSASPLTAGQIVFREHPPLIVFPDRWPGTTYQAFRAAPHEVQNEILGLYSPVTGLKAQLIKKQISGVRGLSMAEQELVLKVMMVSNQNCFMLDRPKDKDADFAAPVGGLPSDQVDMNVRQGLFKLTGTLSHSCQPNCSWTSTETDDGDAMMTVRAT